MEFKAVMKEGKLFIKPNVVTDKDGNVTVHALNPEVEASAKKEILEKIHRGEPVDLTIE